MDNTKLMISNKVKEGLDAFNELVLSMDCGKTMKPIINMHQVKLSEETNKIIYDEIVKQRDELAEYFKNL